MLLQMSIYLLMYSRLFLLEPSVAITKVFSSFFSVSIVFSISFLYFSFSFFVVGGRMVVIFGLFSKGSFQGGLSIGLRVGVFVAFDIWSWQ